MESKLLPLWCALIGVDKFPWLWQDHFPNEGCIRSHEWDMHGPRWHIPALPLLQDGPAFGRYWWHACWPQYALGLYDPRLLLMYRPDSNTSIISFRVLCLKLNHCTSQHVSAWLPSEVHLCVCPCVRVCVDMILFFFLDYTNCYNVLVYRICIQLSS